AEAAKQAIQSGAPLSPEAQKALEAHPELKNQLPPDLKQKVEEKLAEKKSGTESAPKTPASDASPESFGLLPAYDWKTSSYVGRLFLGRLPEVEARSLPHFGHDLFAPRAGVASLENMPPSADYVVGPGDEIVVKMWGRVEGIQRMTVDRDGKIFFPKFGALYVAGKSFSELKSYLRSKVSTIAEVSSDVTLGQMKGIRVSLIGEVRLPGWYNVSSLHTALQVLAMAGGVKDIGTLRRIEVRRGNRVVETIDLYDFLLKGETGSDTRLLSGDTIFVPVVGRLAALTGEVRRPAIYELGREKTVLDLIRMAGGFTPSAFKRRVQVERLENFDARIVLDVDADDLEKSGKAFDLSDGDIVRVLPLVKADANAVFLEGNVVRPGKYELKPGMTVRSLLPDVGAFLPETYFDYALLTRLVPPDFHKEVVPVNLRAIVLEGKAGADVALKAQDTLTVFPRSAFRDSPKVTISGEVRRPGAFDLKKGSRVTDLVKLAGDLTKVSLLSRAEVVRIDEKMRTFRTIYFDLGKAMAGDEKENLVLEDEDLVRIHSLWETQYRKTVTVAGDVNNPGDQILTEGMRLSDLLFKAGGFKESGYTREAELIRREVTPRGDLVKTQTLIVYPDKVLRGEAAADIPLKEYDLLVVRQIPDWAEKIVVTLTGEVQFPGAYAARKGERLSSVITRAGGFTKDAYLKAALFSRASTQRTQQEAIDKLIDDLEMEVAQKGQQVSGALDKEDVEANKELLIARRALIAQLKKTRAKGRVIIYLAANGKVEGTLGDVLLEDGDRLDVPKKMNVVNVVGRVYNPTGIVFDPARDSVGYYLRMVGGPTESADRKHIFLLKADGSVVTRETAGAGFFAFGDRGLMSARVEPGDSILVPEKLVQVRFMKDVKDITQILYQIAVTAGVLLVVF
ncbi:SLBB domain-containing protein, partial [Candidatus Deferrimicrobium sp.]|uniref:SLBB domain-containing protein n=1 Tax=Candidatus Deferrimicrobium sp. TaxID=3060586 RepID=UPI002723457C